VAESRNPYLLTVTCDNKDALGQGRGGCGRPIAEVIGDPQGGDVKILGPILAQNEDPGGTLTTMVPGMRIGRRRRGAYVIDTTNPADRPPPELRTDLLEARRRVHEAGGTFPDGRSYEEGIAYEIAKYQQLREHWDPAGASSGTGRRTFMCDCGRGRDAAGQVKQGRAATVSQAQLNAAYAAARATGRSRITLADLRTAVGEAEDST